MIDPLILFYLIAGMVISGVWLVMGMQLGNTETPRERRWLISAVMLTCIFWPVVLLLLVISVAMGDDDDFPLM